MEPWVDIEELKEVWGDNRYPYPENREDFVDLEALKDERFLKRGIANIRHTHEYMPINLDLSYSNMMFISTNKEPKPTAYCAKYTSDICAATIKVFCLFNPLMPREPTDIIKYYPASDRQDRVEEAQTYYTRLYNTRMYS
ncbi:MAG: hypothetical protein LBC09_05895 [Helicobacteraceae bacterium]|jgi:hypothetical protein|nr:hypothetical protein [Helicobacteraceae bacterium]